MTDDYEILPSDEVEYLRREIEKIKAKPFGSDTDTLIGSIRQLQSSIDALVRVFAEANNIVSNDTSKTTSNNDSNVLSRLEMQNEKIAKSILNLATNIRNQERFHKTEQQEFVRKKEKQEQPQVTSGIAPSGLAPLSAAPKQAEHDRIANSPFGPKSHERIPQKKADNFSFNNGGANGDDDEMPEPPRPLY